MSARAVDAGQVVGYFQRSLEIVKPNLLMLAVATLVMVIVTAIFALIPILGQLAGPAFQALFGAGMLMLVRDSQTGRAFDFSRLFAAFQNQPMMINLLIVAAPAMAIGVLQWLLVKAGMGVFALLLSLVGIAYGFIVLFAVPRVVFGGVVGVQAITESLDAVGKNIVPLILYIVFVIIAILLGCLALIIGLFFILPIIYGAQLLFTDEVFGHNPGASMGGPMAPPPPPAPGWK